MVIYLSVLKVRLERYRALLKAVSDLEDEFGYVDGWIFDDVQSVGEEIDFVDGLLGGGGERLECVVKKG